MTKVRDVMTSDPLTLSVTETVANAARVMKDHDVGDVIVVRSGKIAGIVTDRDIVVRVVAEGKDPARTRLSDVSSAEMVTISADDDLERSIGLMREHALRRLPVVEGDKAVGIVSLGDLAIERDPNSLLAGVSAAPGNA